MCGSYLARPSNGGMFRNDMIEKIDVLGENKNMEG